MVRAGAKNYAFTAVVVHPESYDAVLEELRDAEGCLSCRRARAWRRRRSPTRRATTRRSRGGSRRRTSDFPLLYVRAFEKFVDLPYGENPHQRAAYYAQVGARMHVLSMVRQHHGKQLSFNNLLDLDSARRLVREFEVPACAIVKHNNPCGVALGKTAQEAYERAFACDPLSAFGGVIAINSAVDETLAKKIAEQFVEVLIAPEYGHGALAVLMEKPNVRLLEDEERRVPALRDHDIKQVAGGLLVQDRDADLQDRADMQVVTKRSPSEHEWSEMLFAWRIARHVRSNAIVITRDLATVGIGAGQMSRVDSVRLALEKSRAESLEGAALASDAFFPFSDGPDLAVEAGVRSIIQPGGSVRDEEVIDAADAADVTMVFTHRRHFRH